MKINIYLWKQMTVSISVCIFHDLVDRKNTQNKDNIEKHNKNTNTQNKDNIEKHNRNTNTQNTDNIEKHFQV
jgi:hypothetical protein